MNFRSKHIADSVTERIAAIAARGAGAAPATHSKGAAAIQLARGENGDLLVSKTFEHGEPELMTISTKDANFGIPPGFSDVTPGDQAAPTGPQPFSGIDDGGILESAALGGDSLDALLRD